MDSFWQRVVLGNPIRDWLFAMAVIAGSFIILIVAKRLVIASLRKWSAGTRSTIDDYLIASVDKFLIPFLYFFSIYSALNILQLDPRVARIAKVAILMIGIFFVIRFITSAFAYLFDNYSKKNKDQIKRTKQIRGIMIIVNFILWIGGIIFLVDNLGYDITTIIAGLGIGGIAVALASQAILGDLFSYFVIFFDKPFEIGDFITVDEKLGSVEYIGIKTTRLRTLSGEQLVFSNTDLTNSRVHNYKRMEQRRIEFSFRIVYETPLEKIKAIPKIVKSIIEAQEKTLFDRAHFKSLGIFSLEFEVIYFVLSPDYNVFMDIQQSVILALYESFQKEQISFAHTAQGQFENVINLKM